MRGLIRTGGGGATPTMTGPDGNQVIRLTSDEPGILESGAILFDAEADGVATSTGTFTPASTDVFEISGFSSGVTRMRLKYHYELSTTVTQGPVVPFILVTLAPDAGTAAAIFQISTATIKAQAFTTQGNVRVLSPQNPEITYNLSQASTDFSNADNKIFGVAVANSSTGVDEVLFSWEGF